MEIATSPMTDRQRQYRATYRKRIAGWYNGWLHVFVIYVIRIDGTFHLWRQHREPALVGVADRADHFPGGQLLRMVDPPLRHASTVADQGVPRDLQPPHLDASPVLHRAGDALCQPQRLARHLLPPYALVTFTLMSIVPAMILGWLISPNVGWLLISTTTSMYLIYGVHALLLSRR